MPLKKTKSLAVLAAACLVLGLVGCQQNYDVSTGQTATEQSEANIAETESKELQQEEHVDLADKDSYGSPAYPLSGDWTFEKIVNLIEIDGVPFGFSSDIEDFNNINEKVKAERDKDFIDYYNIYYDNELIIKAQKSQEKSDMGAIISSSYDNREMIDAITFAGYSFLDLDEIYSYMNENFTVSQNGEVAKRYSFLNDGLILELTFFESDFNSNELSLIVISIKEVE